MNVLEFVYILIALGLAAALIQGAIETGINLAIAIPASLLIALVWPGFLSYLFFVSVKTPS